MVKSKEPNALKNEVEALNMKLAGLNEDELKQVSGGFESHDIEHIVLPGDAKHDLDRIVDEHLNLMHKLAIDQLTQEM